MRVIEHPYGPWDERADAVLSFDVEDDLRELIWARFVGDIRFEICSIPFIAYGVALGDVVEAPDMLFERVIQASGRWVVRVWFEQAENARSIIDDISAAGGQIEIRGSLIAVDAPNRAIRETIVGPLIALKEAGVLDWEPGTRVS